MTDGVVTGGRAGRLRKDQQITRGIEQPVVNPDARGEADQVVEGDMEGQEGGDGRAVLRKPGNEVEELDMPGS